MEDATEFGRLDILLEAQRLERIDDPEDLWRAVCEVFARLGFEFVIHLTTDIARTDIRMRTNIPQLYDLNPVETDPFLEYCCNSYEITPTGVGYVRDYDYLPEVAKAFIRDASRIGFRSGIGVPTRVKGSPHYGGFNLGTRLSVNEFEDTVGLLRDEVRVLCILAHRKMEELRTLDVLCMAKLSPRERQVIRMISSGLSRKDCARELDLSPNTVAEYSKSAYRKLGVRNRAEAAMVLKK